MARYPVYSPKPKRSRHPVLWLLSAAFIAVGVWYFFIHDTQTKQPAQTGGNNGGIVETPNGGDNNNGGNTNVGNGSAVEIDHAPGDQPGTAQQRAQADKDYLRGQKELQAGRLIKARVLLSKAILSGMLNAESQKQACDDLTKLADKIVFSPSIYDGDGYAMLYTFKRRDYLVNVEKKLKLHVPWQILLKINGLSSAKWIRATQTLKMIKGPFHAIVYKKQHVMDLYLHSDGMDPVFVRRVPVGLGRGGITPVGEWIVASKLNDKPKYYPAANSSHRHPISYGQPGYVFGKKGIWIGLKGTEPITSQRIGYGIHSTNAPDSIGKDSSEGCIRLGDEDIDFVYALLYEGWSTVRIRP